MFETGHELKQIGLWNAVGQGELERDRASRILK